MDWTPGSFLEGVQKGMRSETDEQSPDELFDLLGNNRRRWTLHYLASVDSGAVELGELAERIAAWENSTTRQGITSEQRKRIYTSLQQTHLPALDEARLVDFDSDRGLVLPTDRIEDVDVYLEVVEDDLPWSCYYLGVGIVGWILTVGALVSDGFPLLGLPGATWTVLLTLVVTVSGVAHYQFDRRHSVENCETPPEIERP